MKIYKCKICGKEYTSPKSLGGHVAVHRHAELRAKLVNETNINQKAFYGKLKSEYLLNPTKCVICNVILPYKRRKAKICNKICHIKYQNIHNSKNDKKIKIAKCTVCGIEHCISLYAKDGHTRCTTCRQANRQQRLKMYEMTCKNCKKIFYAKGKINTCSKECAHILKSKGGINSVLAQGDTRRSKNEIHFSELCKTVYKEVLTNAPMFNGWDADVILNNEKIAILWDGIWHHKKCTVKHSLEQTQNRDKIKRHEIEKAGYIPYVINDFGKVNPKFVIQEFEKLKEKHPPIL